MWLTIRLVIPFIFASLPVWATTYYVDGTGDTDCSMGDPCSVADAEATAVAGDKVIVEDGSYNDFPNDGNSGTEGNEIIWEAENPGMVTFTQNVYPTQDWTVFKNFTYDISDFDSSPGNTGLLYVNPDCPDTCGFRTATLSPNDSLFTNFDCASDSEGPSTLITFEDFRWEGANDTSMDTCRMTGDISYVAFIRNHFTDTGHTKIWMTGSDDYSTPDDEPRLVLVQDSEISGPNHMNLARMAGSQRFVINNVMHTLSSGDGDMTCMDNRGPNHAGNNCTLGPSQSGSLNYEDGGNRIWGPGVTFLFNEVYDAGASDHVNTHAAIYLVAQDNTNFDPPNRKIYDIRIAHNTFASNYGMCFSVRSPTSASEGYGGPELYGIKFHNNICSDNGRDGDFGEANAYGDTEVFFDHFVRWSNPTSNEAFGNLIGETCNENVIDFDGTDYESDEIDNDANGDPDYFDFAGTACGDPDYADLASRDVTLGASSAATGIAYPVTAMSGSGSSDVVGCVDDPKWLHAGGWIRWNDATESTYRQAGMTIWIEDAGGGSYSSFEVDAIDYDLGSGGCPADAAVITLGSAHTWDDNAEVWLIDADVSTDAGANQTGSDSTAPSWDMNPAEASHTDTTISIQGSIDEAGNIYCGAYTDGSTPTAANVQGLTGTGFVAGDSDPVSANTVETFSITGLTASTTYDVWCVGDDNTNLMASPFEVADITTDAPASSATTRSVVIGVTSR